jgi:hypothetical protein
MGSARLACRAWAELLLVGLQRLAIRPHRAADAEQIKSLLARLPPSAAITLSCSTAGRPSPQQLERALQALQASRHLHALAVDMLWCQHALQESLMQALPQLDQLRSFELRLRGPAVAGSSAARPAPGDPATHPLLAAALASLTGLQRLSLQGAPLCAQRLPQLAGLRHLQQLAFSAACAPRQAALDALAGLSGLQRLAVSLPGQAAARAGPALALPELPHLTALRLDLGGGGGDAGPPRLALSERHCAALQELEVEARLKLPGGCEQLAALRRLHLLGAGGRQAAPLPQLPQLRELRGYRLRSGAAAEAAELAALAEALARAPKLQVRARAAAAGAAAALMPRRVVAGGPVWLACAGTPGLPGLASTAGRLRRAPPLPPACAPPQALGLAVEAARGPRPEARPPGGQEAAEALRLAVGALEALPRLAPGLTSLQLAAGPPGGRCCWDQADGGALEQLGARGAAALAALTGLRHLDLAGGGAPLLRDCGPLATLGEATTRTPAPPPCRAAPARLLGLGRCAASTRAAWPRDPPPPLPPQAACAPWPRTSPAWTWRSCRRA